MFGTQQNELDNLKVKEMKTLIREKLCGGKTSRQVALYAIN